MLLQQHLWQTKNVGGVVIEIMRCQLPLRIIYSRQVIVVLKILYDRV